jgi:hypothetical protein
MDSEISEYELLNSPLRTIKEAVIQHDQNYSNPSVHPAFQSYPRFREQFTSITKQNIAKGTFVFYMSFYLIFTLIMMSIYLSDFSETITNSSDAIIKHWFKVFVCYCFYAFLYYLLGFILCSVTILHSKYIFYLMFYWTFTNKLFYYTWCLYGMILYLSIVRYELYSSITVINNGLLFITIITFVDLIRTTLMVLTTIIVHFVLKSRINRPS